MKIGVCIKQVPLGSAKMDSASGALDRASSGAAINPYDRYALEAALQAAAALKAGLIAVSMGPPSAAEVLREALAMGADRAVLLSDPAFAGSDVSATSRVLAGAFERLGMPELVFCGQQSTDGDTAQLPFALAARLGIPALGWVKGVEYFQAREFSVYQELSGGTIQVSGPYPALFAVGREGFCPRAPSLSRRLAAQKMPLDTWSLKELPDTDSQKYGFSGSPTRVKKIYSPELTAKNPPLTLEAAAAAALILKELKAL